MTGDNYELRTMNFELRTMNGIVLIIENLIFLRFTYLWRLKSAYFHLYFKNFKFYIASFQTVC